MDFHLILRRALRWAKAWGIGGLVTGLLMMLGKTAPFAESGGRPGSVWSYWGWVPAATIFGLVAGLAIGLVFGFVMDLTEDWRKPYELRSSTAAKTVPQVLCGAAAGFLVPAPLAGPTGAILFSVLAAVTAWTMAARDIKAGRHG